MGTDFQRFTTSTWMQVDAMVMQRIIRLFALMAVVGLGYHPTPLAAQDLVADGLRAPVEPHPVADEAISRLKSPYCPGLMLEVCTSYQGSLLRDSLQAMAREGSTTDELVDWVLGRHGEEYLAYPRASGRGLLAWLVPPGALLLGMLAVIVALRYMRDSNPVPEVVNSALSPEEEERLKDALREMDAAEEPIF